MILSSKMRVVLGKVENGRLQFSFTEFGGVVSNSFCVSSTARPNSNVASPVEMIEKTRYIDMIEFGPKLPNIIFGSLDNRDEAWERGYVRCSIRFDGPHILLFPWTADFQEMRRLYKWLQVSRI